MKTLAELYQELMNARILLGCVEDAVKDCESLQAQYERAKAQQAVDRAIETLNSRLAQQGKAFISSNRSIHQIG
jgi:hypothetical protein